MRIPSTKSLKNASQRALRHPTWIPAYAQMWRNRRTWLQQGSPRAEFTPTCNSASEAVAGLLGIPESEVLTAIDERFYPGGRKSPAEAGKRTSLQDGRDFLLDAVGALVAITKPAIMVETGVARGLSSAVILSAMARNDMGHLYSVDLPLLSTDDAIVGTAVPQHVRDRWTLILGPSERKLVELFKQIGEVDIFLHDSDHFYDSQMAEYRLAWQKLKPGAFLLSDDLWASTAFVDFCSDVGAKPELVPGVGGDGIGLVRR